MPERKKFMPTITNYLSDEEDPDVPTDNALNASQSMMNYAEWKRFQKESTEVKNGKKPRVRSDGSMEPLGDISSCDEDSMIDDNEPLFRVVINMEKERNSRRLSRLKKKSKKPSNFLIFSQMKRLLFQQSNSDLTFNDYIRMVQISWETIRPSEQTELTETLDYRIQQYREMLLNFKTILLPSDDTSKQSKYKSLASSVAGKQASSDGGGSSPDIPERLQNLAGSASVYHGAPTAIASSTRISHNGRHSLFSYRQTKNLDDGTSLDYVAKVHQTCQLQQCNNKPVDDLKWDGQYCSAKCLVQDCYERFQLWIDDRHKEGAEGAASAIVMEDTDEDIMQYLATPGSTDGAPSECSSKDDNIFSILQTHTQRPDESDGPRKRQLQRNRLPSAVSSLLDQIILSSSSSSSDNSLSTPLDT